MDKGTHTPGPWAWFGNARNNEVYLATTHSGRRYVMGFQRWGMKGAQPMFQPADRGLVPAANLLKFEVGDKSITGVDAAKATFTKRCVAADTTAVAGGCLTPILPFTPSEPLSPKLAEMRQKGLSHDHPR